MQIWFVGLAVLALAACDAVERAAGTALGPRKAIAELPYDGDRPGAPPLEERGNSVFTEAAFDDTGALLLTQPWFGTARLQVWDTQTGALISGFDAIVPSPGSRPVWMIDGKRRRLFARDGKNEGYALFDLMTGTMIATIADTDNGAGDTVARPPAFREPFAVGLTNGGTQALIFKPGVMELWDVESGRLALRRESPFSHERFVPACVGGVPAPYSDKQCWEWSPDRRELAVAYTATSNATTIFLLIEAATLDHRLLVLPQSAAGRNLTSFAFSHDGRWLAVGTNQEVWLYDRVASAWARSIAPDYKARNPGRAPLRFTPDGRRLILQGDQLRLAVVDIETGETAGTLDMDFENWEGEIKTSADGGSALIYRFVSDTFEVIDGATAKRSGWVCPYFCNVKHNPVRPPMAVSPDGRSVAISHRRGAAVWDTSTDRIRFPLWDAKRKPLPHPMER
jgi:hypothetical protein